MAATQLAASYGGQPCMAVAGSVWGIVYKDGTSGDDGFDLLPFLPSNSGAAWLPAGVGLAFVGGVLQW
jgi:hypothetical protein